LKYKELTIVLTLTDWIRTKREKLAKRHC